MSEIEGSPEAWLIPWFMVVVVAAKIMSGHNEGGSAEIKFLKVWRTILMTK